MTGYLLDNNGVRLTDDDGNFLTYTIDTDNTGTIIIRVVHEQRSA
jgi:hypothetical protein